MTIHPKPKPPKRAKKSAKKFIKSRSDAYRKQLERKADEMVRNIVLLRDGFCVCPAPEKGHTRVRQCGHLITRTNRALRWSLVNCHEQCSGCNARHEYRAEHYTQAFIAKFGAGEYMKLVEDGANPCKLSIEDMESLVSELGEIYKLQQIDSSLKPRFTQEQILTGEWRTVNGLRLMTSYPVDREVNNISPKGDSFETRMKFD